MSYSERIKQFREARKLTHQQFADAVGVSRGAIQQWESGATAPKRPNQPVVAKFMGISVSDLMSDTASTPPAQLPVPAQNKAESMASVEEGAINSEATLGQTLDRLGQLLEKADAKTRNDVAALLLRYAQDPAQGKRLAQAIEILLSGAN